MDCQHIWVCPPGGGLGDCIQGVCRLCQATKIFIPQGVPAPVAKERNKERLKALRAEFAKMHKMFRDAAVRVD